MQKVVKGPYLYRYRRVNDEQDKMIQAIQSEERIMYVDAKELFFRRSLQEYIEQDPGDYYKRLRKRLNKKQTI